MITKIAIEMENYTTISVLLHIYIVFVGRRKSDYEVRRFMTEHKQ